MVAINVLDVLCLLQQDKVRLHESHLRIMVEAKTLLLRSASWKLLKENNHN